MAFLRYFPRPEALAKSHTKLLADQNDSHGVTRARSDFRTFTRLTSVASWRSEYLLRTRLLRSVARGKPGASLGGLGGSARSITNKKSAAVLTYNSKLPWMISNVHAVFGDTKKDPRVIVGAADFCISTVSNPSTGKVQKSGLDAPFAFNQLDQLFPNLEPHGLGDGPAAVYNVMDVSQLYGIIGGEGFPGGRPYHRAINEVCGRYLGDWRSPIINMAPEVPKIPEMRESICSVWIAKTSAVPTVTENMVGMMTGSSLGIVTTYALGHANSGTPYKPGEMTARWVLSPGVPIIALKIDESYSHRRRNLGRIWACAVNALGEVFVLSQTPTPPTEAVRREFESSKVAWLAARTVYWDLVESTRRQARPDEFDKNAIRGAYSPRSPCDAMRLGKEQMVAEAREIEKFMRYEPVHFRNSCKGWDMRRRVEVDFAEEIIVVCRCIQGKDTPAEILRHTRAKGCENDDTNASATTNIEHPTPSPSIFGSGSRSPVTTSVSTILEVPTGEVGEWRTSTLSLKKLGKADITSTAIDNSLSALLGSFEDPLLGNTHLTKDGAITPTNLHHDAGGEIPGRRARLFGIGTDHGQVILWNIRDESSIIIEPLCSFRTESPDITSLAISALYVVSGGSDGLVQAWDPLMSTLEPIRTLNSKQSGRAPRHLLNGNPVLRQVDYSTCSAIFLDPDATSLRGILCFGTLVRCWTYSSAAQTVGRKRRTRHTDVHGHLASRRQGHAVNNYIVAEEAELRSEHEHRDREDARLRNRFGVGNDLTEEETIRYAQMISEEAYLADELRRTSASDTGSTADIGETISTSGSLDTVTSDPSLTGRRPSTVENTTPAGDNDFEQQIQRALRLSLLEGASDIGRSPPANSSTDFEFSSTDFEFQVKYKPQKSMRSAPTSRIMSQAYTPLSSGQASRQSYKSAGSPITGQDIDEDLALALRLSLQDEDKHQTQAVGLAVDVDNFPTLTSAGKGKGVARY